MPYINVPVPERISHYRSLVASNSKFSIVEILMSLENFTFPSKHLLIAMFGRIILVILYNIY